MNLVMWHWVLLPVFWTPGTAQLTVNVKNRGGDGLKESIQSNTTQDTVTLEFQESDGTHVTEFIDFRNEIQVFKILVLGEEELDQTDFQGMCFVIRFIKNEFISSDAMSKLRQKNPGAIRHPEEDKGLETYVMDLRVSLDRSQYLSPHLRTMCQEALDATYTRDSDLKILSRVLGKDYSALLSATKPAAGGNSSRCGEVTDNFNQPCMCYQHVCVGWYPCGLKYCRGKDSSGKVVSYRCGIKTCQKCRRFEYHVRRKSLCLWDEAE